MYCVTYTYVDVCFSVYAGMHMHLCVYEYVCVYMKSLAPDVYYTELNASQRLLVFQHSGIKICSCQSCLSLDVYFVFLMRF